MRNVLIAANNLELFVLKHLVPYLELFKENDWSTWIAARNDTNREVSELPHIDHFLDVPFSRNPLDIMEHRSSYLDLVRLFQEQHFDLVHVHTPIAAAIVRLAAKEARRSGVKVIYTAHGFHFFKGASPDKWLLWFPIEKYLSRFCDLIITINREDFERASKFAVCPVEYTHGNGMNIKRFEASTMVSAIRDELKLTPSDKVIVSIGELNKNKNHSLAIRTLAELDDEKYKLVICGSGPLESRLRDLAESLGIENRVHLLGHRADVLNILTDADVYIHTAIREGLPISVLEAMAQGVPVVARKTRGIYPDLITSDLSGIVVAGDKPEAFAEAIRMIFDGRANVPEIIQNSKSIAQRFSVCNVLEEYMRVLSKMSL